MIIPPWVKYFYNCLPMGVNNLLYILQHKMNDLFYGFEFIHAYIDNLLVFKKGDCIDHVQKLFSTLNKLEEKGLKCNIQKSFFGRT